jgi:hypothetical protein
MTDRDWLLSQKNLFFFCAPWPGWASFQFLDIRLGNTNFRTLLVFLSSILSKNYLNLLPPFHETDPSL